MRYNLALAYFDLSEYEGAARQYETIIKLWPDDPKGYFLLTKTYVMDQKHQEAIKTLELAHALSPGDVKDLLELGDMMSEQKAYAEAKQAYEMALEADQESEVIYKKLGFVSLDMGSRQQAEER